MILDDFVSYIICFFAHVLPYGYHTYEIVWNVSIFFNVFPFLVKLQPDKIQNFGWYDYHIYNFYQIKHFSFS